MFLVTVLGMDYNSLAETMVEPISPEETHQYRYLRELSPEELYQEGSRYWVPIGQLSEKELLIGYIGTAVIEKLSDAALALLGKSGVIQLSSQLLQESMSESLIREKNEDFLEGLADEILRGYGEKELKQAAGKILLLSDEKDNIDYVDELVGRMGFIRSDQSDNEISNDRADSPLLDGLVSPGSVRTENNSLETSGEPQRSVKGTPPIESRPSRSTV